MLKRGECATAAQSVCFFMAQSVGMVRKLRRIRRGTWRILSVGFEDLEWAAMVEVRGIEELCKRLDRRPCYSWFTSHVLCIFFLDRSFFQMNVLSCTNDHQDCRFRWLTG